MNEKRKEYRRYEDRRVSVMLEAHEILFDHAPGITRDELLLKSIVFDYNADGAVFARYSSLNSDCLEINASCGACFDPHRKALPAGKGLRCLMDLQNNAPGALTFTRVKRPAVFPETDWDSLWEEVLLGEIKALLTVKIQPQKAPLGFLWILQASFSREWSSRDRNLAEEIAVLLAKAADKTV